MKTSRKFLLPLLLILAASLLLSACTGGRFVPEGWPGMHVEGDTLYVAYRDHIYFLVRPSLPHPCCWMTTR